MRQVRRPSSSIVQRVPARRARRAPCNQVVVLRCCTMHDAHNARCAAPELAHARFARSLARSLPADLLPREGARGDPRSSSYAVPNRGTAGALGRASAQRRHSVGAKCLLHASCMPPACLLRASCAPPVRLLCARRRMYVRRRRDRAGRARENERMRDAPSWPASLMRTSPLARYRNCDRLHARVCLRLPDMPEQTPSALCPLSCPGCPSCPLPWPTQQGRWIEVEARQSKPVDPPLLQASNAAMRQAPQRTLLASTWRRGFNSHSGSRQTLRLPSPHARTRRTPARVRRRRRRRRRPQPLPRPRHRAHGSLAIARSLALALARMPGPAQSRSRTGGTMRPVACALSVRPARNGSRRRASASASWQRRNVMPQPSQPHPGPGARHCCRSTQFPRQSALSVEQTLIRQRLQPTRATLHTAAKHDSALYSYVSERDITGTKTPVRPLEKTSNSLASSVYCPSLLLHEINSQKNPNSGGAAQCSCLVVLLMMVEGMMGGGGGCPHANCVV